MAAEIDDDVPWRTCEVCGAEMIFEDCWYCGGAGGFHDCGEDCCCCLHPDDDLNETCTECGGAGGYWVCTALPHDAPSPPPP